MGKIVFLYVDQIQKTTYIASVYFIPLMLGSGSRFSWGFLPAMLSNASWGTPRRSLSRRYIIPPVSWVAPLVFGHDPNTSKRRHPEGILIRCLNRLWLLLKWRSSVPLQMSKLLTLLPRLRHTLYDCLHHPAICIHDVILLVTTQSLPYLALQALEWTLTGNQKLYSLAQRYLYHNGPTSAWH